MVTHAFIPVPNVAQVDMIYTQDNQPVENVYHYQFAAPPTALDLNNLIDSLKTWETDHGAGLRSDDVALVRIKARDLTTVDGIGVDRQIVPAIVGTNVAGAMPNNVTLAMTWRTGLAGRSFRGRTYHIGLVKGTLTAPNQVSNAGQASLIAAYTLLLDVDPAGSPPLVVVSRRHANADRLVGIATPVTACTTDGFVDSQRRRLPFHNRHR